MMIMMLWVKLTVGISDRCISRHNSEKSVNSVEFLFVIIIKKSISMSPLFFPCSNLCGYFSSYVVICHVFGNS